MSKVRGGNKSGDVKSKGRKEVRRCQKEGEERVKEMSKVRVGKS